MFFLKESKQNAVSEFFLPFSSRFLFPNDALNPIEYICCLVPLIGFELTSWNLSFVLCEILFHKGFFNVKNYSLEDIQSPVLFGGKICISISNSSI